MVTMRVFPSAEKNPDETAVSLRTNFTWTFAGNAFYAAGQWAILSLIAKLGGSDMLGHYAFAIAVTAPAVMLFHLNLRSVLATDTAGHHPFGDYVAARFGTTAVGLAVISVIAWFASNSGTLTAAILAVGVAQSSETVSDIYHGALQRREHMEIIARSMVLRTLVSVSALGVTLWITRDLVSSVIALALGRLAVLIAYDRPAGSAGEDMTRSGTRAAFTIFRTALPLGIVLMLVSLNTNLPRYAIEHHLGTRELGAFAAVVSFMTVGSTVANAMGQASMPRLARHFAANDARFGGIVARLLLAALGLGAAGILVSVVLGRVVLRILYRPEYEAYVCVLVAAMGATVPVYIAIILGYAATSTRSFFAQMPLLCCVAASSGVASWLLVPRYGLYGATMAMAAAACVQMAGYVWILARAFGNRGTAA